MTDNNHHEPLPAVLAIDGGNSKTDVALIADDGSVLAQGQATAQLRPLQPSDSGTA